MAASLKDVEWAGVYTSEIAMAGFRWASRMAARPEVLFDRQDDGRFRSDEIVPDRELKITAHVDGFKPVSRTLRLAEGKTEELTFVLEPR